MKILPSDKTTGNTKVIKMWRSGEATTGYLPLGASRGKYVNGENPIQPVVTIDDLEKMAQQLLASIRIFKTYKYPLSLRRGIKVVK